MERRQRNADGFGAFFRWYTKTWVHAVATAALTGFGILTFVHRYFAALAVAAYVLPPVALYFGDASLAESRASVRTGDSPPDLGEQRVQTDDQQAQTDGEQGAQTDGEQQSLADPTDERDDPSGSADGSDPSWRASSVPTDETLHDVVVADDRAFAVGAGGGVFAGGGGWKAVIEDGPGAQSNALRGIDAVRDGGVWFAGDGGAVGRVDPATDRHVDYSAPNDDSTAIADVAVAGNHGGETILLADGSGRIRRGRYDGGELAWDEPITPGSGSSVTGIAMLDESVGYVCDSNQSVFRTSDGGRSFERIGPDSANGTLSDVAAIGDDECVASADDGVCHRFDGTTWTPRSLGDDPLQAIAARDDHWIACGDGGLVYERGSDGYPRDERTEDVTGWRGLATPATVPLHGCSLGVSTAVAVGDDGTVVERTLNSSVADALR